MKWGSFEVNLVSDGAFWLDGGAMFGVVPRALWAKKMPPDEKNRIRLALNCLLVRTEAGNVLVDTGCGRKYSQKEFDIYRIENQTDVQQELRKLNVLPEAVDYVVNTHLHFDHCGGNTLRIDGEVVPSFPDATYVVSRREYEDANHPNERTHASYMPENWKPVEDRGQLRLTEEMETALLPGITLMRTPGHTSGHQSVLVESLGRKLFFLGDLCPTSAHLPLPWNMGYDLFPLTVVEYRKRIYRRAVEEEWLLFFEHDPEVPCGYLREEAGKYMLQPAPLT